MERIAVAPPPFAFPLLDPSPAPAPKRGAKEFAMELMGLRRGRG